jgi:hypothetical protein
MERLRVYIGWDRREDIAYRVARHSLLEHASIPVSVQPIKLDDLISAGLYTRDPDPLASTEFTYSRFLTPYLAGYQGWALFCDCDFLFFGDVAELESHIDDRIAVACVKHDFRPKNSVKMDGKIQTSYPRKNWSSFMLFNCSHPSTRRLTVERVNRESGAYLHRMRWAEDHEIGEIPTDWNWLEGWNEPPARGRPRAVHFTNGGPWFEEWRDVTYAREWMDTASKVREASRAEPGGLERQDRP